MTFGKDDLPFSAKKSQQPLGMQLSASTKPRQNLNEHLLQVSVPATGGPEAHYDHDDDYSYHYYFEDNDNDNERIMVILMIIIIIII